MASYEIQWKHSAEKDLRVIGRQFISRILESINSLSGNPFPPQHRKLQGAESSYRIRIGNYRVIYQADIENKAVVIYHVRHRKDIYRKQYQ